MEEITADARIVINRPAPDVFDAFADASIMTQFWFPKATGSLEEGKDVKWYVGTAADAYEITVRVLEVDRPRRLRIEWGDGSTFTSVTWAFESAGAEQTVVRIRESGFIGTQSEITGAALASTAGFNQVITAAKCILEHGARINVVRDHAD